jgi:hypothetical protein
VGLRVREVGKVVTGDRQVLPQVLARLAARLVGLGLLAVPGVLAVPAVSAVSVLGVSYPW